MTQRTDAEHTPVISTFSASMTLLPSGESQTAGPWRTPISQPFLSISSEEGRPVATAPTCSCLKASKVGSA